MKRRLKSEAVRIKRYALFLFQYIFLEKTRGLDFSMRIMTTRKEKNPLYHGYSKTNEKHLKMILSELNFEKCKNFLDIGRGKGVVLKEAVKYPFKKVAGIELLPHLVKTAKKNFNILHLADKISCTEANAADYEEYSEYDTFFLFNPFGEDTLIKVAQKLNESIRQNKRDITIIYHNPRYIHIFEKMPGYQLEKELYDPLKGYKTCILWIEPEGRM